MAALVIALGRARVDPPLVDREAAAADKAEAQTGARQDAGFLISSNEAEAFLSQSRVPADLFARGKHAADKGVLMSERLPALRRRLPLTALRGSPSPPFFLLTLIYKMQQK